MHIDGEPIFLGSARCVPEVCITEIVPKDAFEKTLLREVRRGCMYYPDSLFKFRMCYKTKWIFAHSINEILEAIKKKTLYDI